MPTTRRVIRFLVAVFCLAPAALWAADVTLFEHDEFGGRRFEVDQPMPDLGRFGFSETASSLVIARGTWELCPEPDFRGRCVVYGPGRYGSLGGQDFNDRAASIRRTGGSEGGWTPGGGLGNSTIEAFEHIEFGGRRTVITGAEPSLRRIDMNDAISSLMVRGGSWQLCSDDDFRGRCVVVGPGRYATLVEMGLNDEVSSARPAAANSRPDYGADLTFYEHDNFGGRRLDVGDDIADLGRSDFNDTASSIMIERGRWEVCVDADFRGKCVVLGPGRHESLGGLGLNDEISSVRRVGGGPIGGPIGDNRPGGPGNVRPDSPTLRACVLALQTKVRRERPGAQGIEIFPGGAFEVPAGTNISQMRARGRYQSSRGERGLEVDCTYDATSRRVMVLTYRE